MALRQLHSRRLPVIHIPKADVFSFGASTSSKEPALRGIEWTVHEDEAWAVVGSGKAFLFQTLLGHMRLSPFPPPPGGLYPLLSQPASPSEAMIDPYSRIAHVSFSHKRCAGGAFYDYTARYGAVRDEDRTTLRQSMFPLSLTVAPDPMREWERAHKITEDWTRKQDEINQGPQEMEQHDRRLFDELVDALELRSLLDLPLISLSNGQMRRARIVRAALRRPELMFLDEPFTGLDVLTRPMLSEVLKTLHFRRAPRIVFGLQAQDPVPSWVTNVLHIGNPLRVTDVKNRPEAGNKAHNTPSKVEVTPILKNSPGALLVDMKDVTVQYGPRIVLNKINWQIRQGERWHLQGTNGSGKTTLLSLLTGDHPQSYVQHHLYLPALSTSSTPVTQPRKRIPSPHLRSLIGVVSPELADAFPRRHPGMTVWEAVGTGFDGGFIPRDITVAQEYGLTQEENARLGEWRTSRCWDVLEQLGPGAWTRYTATDENMASNKNKKEMAEAFSKRLFTDLPLGEQKIVLLMRALVGKAPLVLLDEVWSGMDEKMIHAARKYLRSIDDKQAVVVVTHWEQEVPWSEEDGVLRLRLAGDSG